MTHVEALTLIRDRRIKPMPKQGGGTVNVCLLCGAHADSEPHSGDFNCVIAQDALAEAAP